MSNERLPVEVDMPSDARWERIGREMFAKLDAMPPAPRPGDPGAQRFSPRRAVGWVLVTAAAAAALIVVVRGVHPMLSALAVQAGETRARLETGEGASQFTVGESSLLVAPRSLVLVAGDDDHGVDVVLDRGAVTCIVAPRRGRPAFIVDAGDVRVRVVGTRFTVVREPAGASVEVEHGVVEVVAHGVVVSLHDGQHWPDGPAPAPIERQESRERPEAPATALPTAPPGASASAPPAAPTPGPKPVTASASPPGKPGQQPPRETRSAMASAAVPDSEEAAPTSAPVATLQEQFESATRIERVDPDEATSVYVRIAAGGSVWAPNALFALARLEADRGRREDAARHLNEYLTRYPRGINADDARALLRRTQ